MADITLRSVKGSPLTNQEVDDNFANLNDDKVEIGGDLSGNTEAPIVSAIQGVAVSATAPSTNQVLTFTGSQLEFSNIPPTNLGTSANATTRTVTSSTGTNVVLPSANTTQAGVMTSADRTKLDGVEAGAEVNVPTNLSIGSSTGTVVRIDSSTGTNATIPVANTTFAGVVTAGTQSFAGTKTFTSTISGSIDGNASTATTLATARDFTIGSTTRSFDGSASVSWSLSDIGINNNTLTLATSGIATGSQTWTSNQGTNATFTVTVPGTNLGTSANTTTRTVTSSTGDNVVLPSANTTQAGILSSDDKKRIDRIEAKSIAFAIALG